MSKNATLFINEYSIEPLQLFNQTLETMISLSEFRKFVYFIEKKIQPLATQYEEFRLAALEVKEKAKEIESSIAVESDSESVHSEEETDHLLEHRLTSPVPSESAQSAQSLQSNSQREAPQQVKRRKTRVRRKINQVCKACFVLLCPH